MPPDITPKTLTDWLLLLEQRHPVAIDMGLDRVNLVLRRLNLDFSTTRIITVGGTNGKGSTATLCAALLQAHGATVGLYTSPHLLDFRERIVVNGQMVRVATLLDAFDCVEQACGSTSLTYFEFTTLAALQVFCAAGVSWCVLEVGLGGRLDAVNALSAEVSVITSIGLDHTHWLGDTLAQIAFEKAGIARSDRPLVVAPTAVDDVIENIAQHKGAQLIQPGEPHHRANEQWSPSAPHPLADIVLPMPQLPLNSAHLALHALAQANVVLDPNRVADVLRDTQMPGRMQALWWQGLPMWLDVAHNGAAASWVAARLQSMRAQWTIILGMRQDKDVVAVVNSLRVVEPFWILLDLSAQPQGLSGDDIKRRSGLQTGVVAGTMLEALTLAHKQQQATLICGSFLTISAALEVMQPQDDHE